MNGFTSTYPNVADKHLDPVSLFTPADFLGWALRSGWDPGPLPVGVVFTFQGFVTSFVADHPNRFVEAPALAPSNARVFLTADEPVVGISCLNPGATSMVTQVEHLLYLRERGFGDTSRFVVIGTAGALVTGVRIAETALITAAVRDDAISHHYLPPGRYVRPTGELTEALRRALVERVDELSERVTWTVPVPYRVTAGEIREYVAEGVTLVEEEAAALFAVTQAQGVESAAAVVVSDVMTESGRFDVEWHDTVGPLTTVLDGAIAAIRASAGG